MRTTSAHYDQDFIRSCQSVVVKTLCDYGCEVHECACRPSWAVATNFSMRVETQMHRDLGYAQTSIRNDLYRIFDTIKTVALKAGAALQGLPIYDVRICLQEDPSAYPFEKRIIIQIVHDPMPNTVDLDDKAPKMEPGSYNLQSARLIRD